VTEKLGLDDGILSFHESTAGNHCHKPLIL